MSAVIGRQLGDAPLLAALGGCVLALLAIGTALTGRVLLARLGEPDDGAEQGKLPYTALATPRFAVAVGGCSAAALLVLTSRAPPALWPLWLPLATLGVLLGCIDAATTWLPLRLTRPLWVLTAVGAAGTVLAAGWRVGVRALLGALLCFAFWWLIWRFVGGLGFGDVRLAPVLGATAAAGGWGVLVWAMLLGTFAGAAFGLYRTLRGRRGAFAYGPALLIGQFAALIWPGLG
ncbi:hypothetical protein BI335_07755 [Enemella evansiae]|nr:hypothetical protein BI335_07755 [Enemella evansiae]